jgi:acyl-CoA thioesterase I
MPSLILVELMQRIWFGVLLLAVFVTLAPPTRADGGLACGLPPELTNPADPLVNASEALTKHNSLNILALGSGSTVGDAGGSGGPAFAFRSPENSFPRKMLAALQALRPTSQFHLTVKGGRNMSAESMLTILKQELETQHYDLVLWQTGTVEAVHGLRPDSMRNDLQEGAELVAGAHADLVLVDPQFSRFLRANVDLGPYEAVLQQMTSNPGVTLFHRLELTQAWVGSGEVDLERVGHDERDKTILLLNTCLGQALARFILTGADQH